MKGLRVKLFSCLVVVCLAVALLVVGIWAAGTQTINENNETISLTFSRSGGHQGGGSSEV